MATIRTKLTKSFTEFVRISSPTGYERKFSLYLKRKIIDLGYSVKRDRRGNLFVTVPGNGNPILLVAHIDTVQPGFNISPIVEKGIIRSKGDSILGADNKSAVAVLYELLRDLKRAKRKHRPIEILFSVCEEAGIPGTETFNKKLIKAKEGLCMDAAQPIGTIILDSPYYLRQKIRIIGRGADASNPKQGVSVIPALVHYMDKVPHGYQSDQTFYNVGAITGGYGTNAILDTITIDAEVRSFDLKELKYHARIAEDLVRFTSKVRGCNAEYQEFLENHGYSFEVGHPWVKTVSDSFRPVAKKVNYLRQYWGISDANNLNKAGIAVINVGNGAKNPHTTREEIAVDDLVRLHRGVKWVVFSKEKAAPMDGAASENKHK